MDYNADYELDNSISIIDNDILLIDCEDNFSEVCLIIWVIRRK